MPKQDAIEEEIPWPLPGRTGVYSRTVLNSNENELHNLGNYRFQYKNYQTGPARTKPKDPSLFGGEDFLRRAVGGNAAHLGWSHPKTMNALTDLARAQKDQGRPDEAEPLLRKAHFEMVSIYGPSHPNTIQVAVLLCQVLEDLLQDDTLISGNQEISDISSLSKGRNIEREVHGDATTVSAERNVPGQCILVKEILDLRQVIAVVYEEQYGPENNATTDAVFNLSIALKRWALLFTEGERQVQVLEHVSDLEEKAHLCHQSHLNSQPPPPELFVPSYKTGHASGKGQPPVPHQAGLS